MNLSIREADCIEIISFQDNYINAVSMDNSEIIERANPLKGDVFSTVISAEPGLSLAIVATFGGKKEYLLYDFGLSENGAVLNAFEMGFDLKQIGAMALSHGHLDHIGGLKKFAEEIGKTDIELVAHPDVFRAPRYVKTPDNMKLYFPEFKRQTVQDARVKLVETRKSYNILNDSFCFLGEIPRRTSFENGMPGAFYDDNGQEKWDDIIDDSAIVTSVKGKGLVVISACAHSGIVNTVNYAREITGIDKVYAVIGGFHLSSADFNSVISPTVEALKEINPQYIVPIHCTGWDAVRHIEKEMPDAFILNMSGTKLTFKSGD